MVNSEETETRNCERKAGGGGPGGPKGAIRGPSKPFRLGPGSALLAALASGACWVEVVPDSELVASTAWASGDTSESAGAGEVGEAGECGNAVVEPGEDCDDASSVGIVHGSCDACSLQCASGFADCDGDPSGCEADLEHPSSCGACDKQCVDGTSCIDGVCAGTVVVSEVFDAVISTSAQETNFGSADRILVDDGGCVGISGIGGRCASLLKATSLGGIPANAWISRASLRIRCFDSGGGVKVHLIDTPWEETEVTWATAPEISTELTAFNPCGGADAIDVTEAVRAWVDGSKPNHGVALTSGSSDGSDYWSRESGTGPLFEIEVAY